ncbi:MAG: hypothetical protein AAF602_05515, partial [Myxococcota bacterium]
VASAWLAPGALEATVSIAETQAPGCRAHERSSCEALVATAVMLKDGVNPLLKDAGFDDVAFVPSPEVARPYLEVACKADSAFGCSVLASMLAAGEGGRAEPARALSILERTCDAGSSLACGTLARFLAEGKGTQADPARAKTLAAKACSEGAAFACTLADGGTR